MITAAQEVTTSNAIKIALTFIAWSLASSGVYLLNDLFDLPYDSAHPTKSSRPLASGTISKRAALVALVLLFFLASSLAWAVNLAFLCVLLAYVALTCAYTFALKKIPILDCLLLAIFYTSRVAAGGVALNLEVSKWLIALSLCLFFSLGLAKRTAELKGSSDVGGKVPGRGYSRDDEQFVTTLGVVSAFSSVLILMLYIDSQESLRTYATAGLLWVAAPCLLYFVARLWLLALRGQLTEDPVLFAVRDLPSIICALGVALAIGLAHIHF